MQTMQQYLVNVDFVVPAASQQHADALVNESLTTTFGEIPQFTMNPTPPKRDGLTVRIPLGSLELRAVPGARNAYEVECEGHDYHVRLESGAWAIDCFTSAVEEADAAFCTSTREPSLEHAAEAILSGVLR